MYPTSPNPINGSKAEYWPATRKTIFAMESKNSLNDGLAIKYEDKKIGKNRKRNVSDVKSICLPVLILQNMKEKL
jgi:hypothetical protein